MTDLAEACRRNTRLLLNALADLPPEAASTSAGSGTNSVEFLALHLVDVRYFLAGYVGLDVENPWAELLRDARGIDDVASFPPLEELARRWREVGERVEARLAAMDERELAEEDELFPMTGPGRGGGVLFLLQHEMYHIGQVALLRRLAGLPAMTWS